MAVGRGSDRVHAHPDFRSSYGSENGTTIKPSDLSDEIKRLFRPNRSIEDQCRFEAYSFDYRIDGSTGLNSLQLKESCIMQKLTPLFVAR
jgi:hypothetical protein